MRRVKTNRKGLRIPELYLIISLRETPGGKDPGNGASFIGPKVRTNPNRRFAVLKEALRDEFYIYLRVFRGLYLF